VFRNIRRIDEPLNPPAFLPDYALTPKPLLIVGLASRRSDDDVSGIRSACKRLKIPALVTYKAKGVIPDDHPWFGGVFTHGLIEEKLIEQSSLLIGVGFDPVEILPRPWKYPQPVVSFSSWELPTDHVPFAHQHVNDIGETMTWVARWMVGSKWSVEDVRLCVDSAKSAVRFAGADDPETLTAQTVVVAAAARLRAARASPSTPARTCFRQ
jgi:acetolactate synthase-1/2/3 large subunit